MSRLDVLNEVFHVVFNDPLIVVNMDTTANDIEGWDSLTHIILISAIEEKFKITFTRKEILGFSCVGDIVNCIENKAG